MTGIEGKVVAITGVPDPDVAGVDVTIRPTVQG